MNYRLMNALRKWAAVDDDATKRSDARLGGAVVGGSFGASAGGLWQALENKGKSNRINQIVDLIDKRRSGIYGQEAWDAVAKRNQDKINIYNNKLLDREIAQRNFNHEYNGIRAEQKLWNRFDNRHNSIKAADAAYQKRLANYKYFDSQIRENYEHAKWNSFPRKNGLLDLGAKWTPPDFKKYRESEIRRLLKSHPWATREMFVKPSEPIFTKAERRFHGINKPVYPTRNGYTHVPDMPAKPVLEPNPSMHYFPAKAKFLGPRSGRMLKGLMRGGAKVGGLGALGAIGGSLIAPWLLDAGGGGKLNL